MGQRSLMTPHQTKYIGRNKYVKRSSTSCHQGKCKLKQLDSTAYLLRVAKISDTDNAKCWRECKATELSFVSGVNAEWYSHFGRQFGNFLQNQTLSYHDSTIVLLDIYPHAYVHTKSGT